MQHHYHYLSNFHLHESIPGLSPVLFIPPYYVVNANILELLVNILRHLDFIFFSEIRLKTTLVVQQLRICLPIQGAWVQSLVSEDSTCLGATKPACLNY